MSDATWNGESREPTAGNERKRTSISLSPTFPASFISAAAAAAGGRILDECTVWIHRGDDRPPYYYTVGSFYGMNTGTTAAAVQGHSACLLHPLTTHNCGREEEAS